MTQEYEALAASLAVRSGYRGDRFEQAAAAIRALVAENERLREALEQAAIWHNDHAKSLSKQPPSQHNGWMRMEHREQAAALRAHLIKDKADV